jgi:peroxiredoxin
MVQTTSTMSALGSKAPDFRLPDVTTGSLVARDAVKTDMGLLVMFICRHCPYVKHIQQELARLGRDYAGKIGIVAISSNDAVAYPDDGPASLKEQAKEVGFTFPYLFDETQEVARAYDAACTPDFFLYDGSLTLVYRGQLDEARRGNDKPVTGKDMRAALDLVIAGQPVPADQKASIGCNIKWKGQPA